MGRDPPARFVETANSPGCFKILMKTASKVAWPYRGLGGVPVTSGSASSLVQVFDVVEYLNSSSENPPSEEEEKGESSYDLLVHRAASRLSQEVQQPRLTALDTIHATSGRERTPEAAATLAYSPLYSSCLTRVASVAPEDVHVLPHSRHAGAISCTGRSARHVCICVQLSPSPRRGRVLE